MKEREDEMSVDEKEGVDGRTAVEKVRQLCKQYLESHLQHCSVDGKAVSDDVFFQHPLLLPEHRADIWKVLLDVNDSEEVNYASFVIMFSCFRDQTSYLLT